MIKCLIIFPECRQGIFGKNCKYQCRCNGTNNCEKVTGRCDVCAPGYSGPQDNPACQTGKDG